MKFPTLLTFALSAASIAKASFSRPDSRTTLEIHPNDFIPSQTELDLCHKTTAHQVTVGSQHNWLQHVRGARAAIFIAQSIEASESATNGQVSEEIIQDVQDSCIAKLDGATSAGPCQRKAANPFDTRVERPTSTSAHSETRQEEQDDAGVGEHNKKESMTRGKHGEFAMPASHKRTRDSIDMLPPDLDFQNSQDDGDLTEATSTVLAGSRATDMPNPNDAQIENPDEWCCVVNKGVKFCFDCPSATSATEVVLAPRATATMTHGTRSLVLRAVGDVDSPQALCCYTTGLEVFGCYLCHQPPTTVNGVWLTVSAGV